MVDIYARYIFTKKSGNVSRMGIAFLEMDVKSEFDGSPYVARVNETSLNVGRFRGDLESLIEFMKTKGYEYARKI